MLLTRLDRFFFFFFLSDRAPPEIYTLPFHAALPISGRDLLPAERLAGAQPPLAGDQLEAAAVAWGLAHHDRIELIAGERRDRKSTRLNSSHSQISYAVFCLKKKKQQTTVVYIADVER